ncbi:MAG: MarR family transcriptional regulator [Clostridia bacterium]|jgi:DNA-binding MarR family transcriptional regulator|nr:MarR family transcriptional regulator [Clostridia bacterium]MBQ5905780.1 MarR family transcriptional regulator [Clostridia bacterium]
MKRKLGFEIGRTSRLIKRVLDNNSQKEYIDKLTGTHGWALGYLHRNRDRDIFQKDFEKEFDIRRSTASHILSLMEENGMITRESVPYDARLKKIVLTEKAMNIEEEVMQFFDKLEQEFEKNITKEELEIFYSVLDKINDNIERIDAK